MGISGNGNLCEDTRIKFPLGAGSLIFHAIDCPISKGEVQVRLDIAVAVSTPMTNDLLKISLTAKSKSGDKLICVDLSPSDQHVRGGVLHTSSTHSDPRFFSLLR